MKKILLLLLAIPHAVFAMRHVQSVDFFELESEQFSKRMSLESVDKQQKIKQQKNLDKNLLFAVIDNDPDLVESLLQKGGNVNSYDQKGYSLVHRAIMRSSEREALWLLVKLLAYNPNLDSVSDYDNETPLMQAVKNGFISVARLLLMRGADPCIENDVNETALHYALTIKQHRLKMIELLIGYGANCDQPDRYDMTPLVYAIVDDDTDLATYLLKQKACVSNCYAPQYIPQLIAIKGFTTLLDLSAPMFCSGWVNELDCERETPLHKAAYFGNNDVVIHLLKYEPNPFYENCDQKIASEIAASKGHIEVAETIINYQYLYLAKNYHQLNQFNSLQ